MIPRRLLKIPLEGQEKRGDSAFGKSVKSNKIIYRPAPQMTYTLTHDNLLQLADAIIMSDTNHHRPPCLGACRSLCFTCRKADLNEHF